MKFLNLESFLSALPAILALTGFIVYQLIASKGSADPVVLRIVQKLRHSAPTKLPQKKLNANQLENLLQQDNALKQLVSEQDFQLLRQVLRQQFIISIVVYSLCAALFV